jgi:hypothetical protein
MVSLVPATVSVEADNANAMARHRSPGFAETGAMSADESVDRRSLILDGIAEFCERYADGFHRWWEDLGNPRLDGANVQRLVDGVRESVGSENTDALAARRDALLTTVIAATTRRDA